MAKFTDEQYGFLEKYERTFLTSINEHYFRNIGSVALNKMADIYQEVTKKPYGSRNWGCGACALTFLCTIGKMFLDEQKEREIEIVPSTESELMELTPEGKEVVLDIEKELMELTPEGKQILLDEAEMLGPEAVEEVKKKPVTKKKASPKKKKETK